MTKPGTSQVWRGSYDENDVRAQVATIYWEVTPDRLPARKFFDELCAGVRRYAEHIREPGKPRPISANARAVLRALVAVWCFDTGRCDPSIDKIAEIAGLSRRTTVRQLDVLRSMRILDWVRRTVKTGNERGEGPPRKQTSNAYFIDLAKLPIELLRTLKQKLGAKLHDAGKKLRGSGPVPSRMETATKRAVRGVAGALGVALGREASDTRRLAGASEDELLAHMYGGDVEAIRQHKEMMGFSSGGSASAKVALYPSSRTLRKKD